MPASKLMAGPTLGCVCALATAGKIELQQVGIIHLAGPRRHSPIAH